MTLNEIRSSDKILLTPGDIAEVIGSNPQTIRDTALYSPADLGFPVCRVGKYTRIPRIPFLRFLGYEEVQE